MWRRRDKIHMFVNYIDLFVIIIIFLLLNEIVLNKMYML